MPTIKAFANRYQTYPVKVRVQSKPFDVLPAAVCRSDNNGISPPNSSQASITSFGGTITDRAAVMAFYKLFPAGPVDSRQALYAVVSGRTQSADLHCLHQPHL
ncbi:MAG: hypothetical protein I8H93_02910 [Pseudomonadales bacterium]|nr:hypothetical protein [Pseudomonadales bacterium]